MTTTLPTPPTAPEGAPDPSIPTDVLATFDSASDAHYAARQAAVDVSVRIIATLVRAAFPTARRVKLAYDAWEMYAFEVADADGVNLDPLGDDVTELSRALDGEKARAALKILDTADASLNPYLAADEAGTKAVGYLPIVIDLDRCLAGPRP